MAGSTRELVSGPKAAFYFPVDVEARTPGSSGGDQLRLSSQPRLKAACEAVVFRCGRPRLTGGQQYCGEVIGYDPTYEGGSEHTFMFEPPGSPWYDTSLMVIGDDALDATRWAYNALRRCDSRVKERRGRLYPYLPPLSAVEVGVPSPEYLGAK